MNWSIILSKFISMILSWLQSGNLRNQMYYLKDQNETMMIALEDIRRMDPDGKVGWIAKVTLDKINEREYHK